MRICMPMHNSIAQQSRNLDLAFHINKHLLIACSETLASRGETLLASCAMVRRHVISHSIQNAPATSPGFLPYVKGFRFNPQANRSLLRLDLDPLLSQLLRTHNLTTARDVLLLSSMDLMELLGLTECQALELTLAVSAHITPPFQTVGVTLIAI